MDENKNDPVFVENKISYLKDQLEAMRKTGNSKDFKDKIMELSYWRNRQIRVGKSKGT